jgi:uncharacterized membrane protein
MLLFERIAVCVIIFFLTFSSFQIISPTSGVGDNENDSGSENVSSRALTQDVDVDNIDVQGYFIVPGIFEKDHYPGQDVKIATKIWNIGNDWISTPFDVLMVVLDDLNEIDVHYEVHLRQTINSIAPLSFVNLSWSWTPPGEPPPGAKWDYLSGGGHSFRVRVISLYEGDQNSSNNFNASQIDIKYPKFSPLVTNQLWEEGVPDTPLKQTIPIGSILYLNFTVNNTASAEDFIKVEAYDLPEDWVVMPGSLPEFLQIKGGLGATVWLRIQVSRDNSLALKAHDYYINIRALSLYSPPQNHTFQFIVNLEYSPLAKFILPKDVTLAPGKHDIDVTLMNIGNGVDNYYCTADVFPKQQDDPWHAIVASGPESQMLETFETTTITVRVTVPPKRKEAYKTIIVTAQSTQESAYNTADEYRFKVYVDQYYGVDLKLSDEVELPLHMTPNDEYSFEMILRNSGNTKDNTISLNVTNAPEGWVVIMETSSIPRGGLGIGVDVDIGVLIRTPQNVLMGDYSISISGMAGIPHQEWDRLNIPVKIIEVGNVHIEARPPSSSGNIGDIVQYKIFIKNNGNRLDTFDFSMIYETEGMHGWGKLSQATKTLDANESFEIVLTVTIPLNASADTNPNTPSVWEGYTINVIVKSQNLSHVAKSVKINTYVSQFYDFDLSADAYIKPIQRGISQPVPFLIHVRNRGNIKDTYEFVLDTSKGDVKWGRLRSKYKSIKPGLTQSVQFEATAPRDIGVGVYDFNIIVSSNGDEEKFREIMLKVFVSSLELSLSKILINGEEEIAGNPINVKGGNSVLITAQIKNTGTVKYDNESFGNCRVVFFDGKSTIGEGFITYLPLQGVMNLSSSWNTTLVTQEWTIYVNIDPDNRITFSSRDNLSQTSKVSVEGPLTGSTVSKESLNMDEYLLPVLIIIILIIVQILSLMLITRTKKSRIKVGYTEDGEYKPFADVFDPFAKDKAIDGEDGEHPYRMHGGADISKASISTTEAPMLPPSTFAVSSTKPVTKTRPLPRTTPIRRKA